MPRSFLVKRQRADDEETIENAEAKDGLIAQHGSQDKTANTTERSDPPLSQVPYHLSIVPQFLMDQGRTSSRIPFFQAFPFGENSPLAPCYLEGHPVFMPQRIFVNKCYREQCQGWQHNCCCGECLRAGYPIRPVEPKPLVNLMGRFEEDGNHFHPNTYHGFPCQQFCGPRVSPAHERPDLEIKPSKCEIRHENNIYPSTRCPEHDNCKSSNKKDRDGVEDTVRKSPDVENKACPSHEAQPTKKIKVPSEEKCDVSLVDANSNLYDLVKEIKIQMPEDKSNLSPSALDADARESSASPEIPQSSQDNSKKNKRHPGKGPSARASARTTKGKNTHLKEQKRYNTRITNSKPRTQKSDHVASSKKDWRKKDENVDEDVTKGRQRTKLNRLLANEHERRRVSQLNSAYHDLRKMIPGYNCDTKLPKIKILRYAIRYIAHLDEILQEPDTKG